MALRPDIAAAMTHASREFNASRDEDSALLALVHTIRDSLPGIDHVSISVEHRNGAVETKVGTDNLLWQLDGVQYELDEGPCLHAIRSAGEPVVRVDRLRHEQRWPRYVARAIEQGVGAQLGLRLDVAPGAHGGLNLYSTTTESIDPDVEHSARIFAAQAAVAVGRARHVEHLTRALQRRKVIGQAIGIVMERYQLNEDRAFEYLTRVSSHSNVKVRDVARDLVEQGNRRGGSTGSAAPS